LPDRIEALSILFNDRKDCQSVTLGREREEGGGRGYLEIPCSEFLPLM
jgi:hypothetical protein